MRRFQKGFTLIELLVVIAVIGVLAAIVLIAIDPLEQINRGNDAANKDKVGQVANAASAAYTAAGATGAVPQYPALQADLVTSGDLKAQITGSASQTLTYAPFDTTTTRDSLVVALPMLSKQNKSRAAAGSPCATTSTAYFTFISTPTTAGRSGLVCEADNDPPEGDEVPFGS